MLKRYPTDLRDKEWKILEPLLPSEKYGGRPRKHNLRDILNAIFYIVRAGCSWRMLPHDFPPWSTTYYYFNEWVRNGVWQMIKRGSSMIYITIKG
jgi:putative transposase